MRSFFAFFLFYAALIGTVTLAPAQPASEQPKTAASYVARETHTDENTTIAVDPCDIESKIPPMKLDYLRYGVLPMRLVITNDGTQPLSLVKMKIELVLADHSKVEPSDEDDLMRVVTNTHRLGNEQDKTLPIPFPVKKGKQKEVKQLQADWDSLPFRALAVEPHNTQSGFLYFNLGAARFKLAGARVFISGLKDGNGKELFYFEIPLDKYLSPAAGM